MLGNAALDNMKRANDEDAVRQEQDGNPVAIGAGVHRTPGVVINRGGESPGVAEGYAHVDGDNEDGGTRSDTMEEDKNPTHALSEEDPHIDVGADVREDGNVLHSPRISPELLNERVLSHDTFSFLIYSGHLSKPSLLAMMVYGIQMTIFVLVSINIIDPDNRQNPLNFPSNVEGAVRITEALALAVAVITQDDVRQSINLLRDGYDDGIFRGTFGDGVSRSKWALSIFLRASEGLLGLFVTFMLVMQSETVLDLLLNFSAMEFVSLVDDVTFSLMTEGFFGNEMKKSAKALYVARYRIGRETNTWKSSFLTGAYFVALFAIMITAWGTVYAYQEVGKYTCQHVFLQLDDSLVPSLGTMSGLYITDNDHEFGGRVSYFRHGMIGYCASEKMWTLTPEGRGLDPDPCEDWIAASSESIHFDVTGTESSQWYAMTGSGRVMPLETTYIGCYDCESEDNFCGEASGYGKCVNNECSCADGRFGLRCEFEEPCPILEVDPRTEGFVGNKEFATRYYLQKGVIRYHRPVYTSYSGADAVLSAEEEEEGNVEGGIDTIMYIGRRWAVTSGGVFDEGYYSIGPVSFLSQAVDVDGRRDMIAYPLGLEWHPSLPAVFQHVQGPDTSQTVDVTMNCASCNDKGNLCLFNGTCLPDGACECAFGSSGSLCQVPPLNNARCDPYFNDGDFEYDGGDCCEGSCVSTDDITCGKDETGFVDVGYFHCAATESDRWSKSGDPVYGVNGAALSGSSVALGGDDGTVLVVGDSGSSVVRLFDKDGSAWVQRGPPLMGPYDSEYGLAVSLSSRAGNARQNPASKPTVTLAVGAPGAELVRVYECRTNGCTTVGDDIVHGGGESRFGLSVSLSSDGSMVAIGGAQSCLGGCFSGYAAVYKRSAGVSGGWELRGNSIPPPIPIRKRKLAVGGTYRLHGYYISMSGDGGRLAVGSIEGRASADEYYNARLATQVYEWNATLGDWVALGKALSNRHYFLESAGRSFWPQRSVVLAEEGKVVAIGSFYGVGVYFWNDTISAWVLREIDCQFSQTMGYTGYSVDINADGSFLAISTSKEDAEGNVDSSIQVHKWNGTYYAPFFNRLPAAETNALSLSRNGMALSVGLPFGGKEGGLTKFYKFRPSSRCGEGFRFLRLSFTTDANPGQNWWTLQFGTNETIRSQPYDDFPLATFVEEFCVPVDSCVKFAVFDSEGNGMDKPGIYSLMLDGSEVAKGGKFDSFEVKFVGDGCDCPSGTSPFSITSMTNNFNMSWNLSRQSGITDYSGKGAIFNNTTDDCSILLSADVVHECIPNDCWELFVFPPASDSDSKHSCAYGDSCGQWSYHVTYNGTSRAQGGGNKFCPSNVAFGECSSNRVD